MDTKMRMTKQDKKQQQLEGEEAYKKRMVSLMDEEVQRVGYEKVRRDTQHFRFIYDNMNMAKITCPYCKSLAGNKAFIREDLRSYTR